MLQSLAIFLGLFATILYLVHYLIRYVKKRYIIDKIPGPYAWPILGNISMFLMPLEREYKLLRYFNYKYHGIHRLWMGPHPVVFLNHPDDIEVLLASPKHIGKGILYKPVYPWLGAGLFTSSSEKWRQRRKILTPTFHFSVLQQFVPIFVKNSHKMVESVCPDKEEVVDDLVSLFQKYTLNSICETAMGSTSGMDEKVLKEYRSCVNKMGDLLPQRVAKPWLMLDWLYRWSKIYVHECRALEVIHGLSTRIIKERRQCHEDTDGQYLKGLGSDEGIYGYDDCDVNGKRRLAMLDLLISASQQDGKIDEKGIREEVDTFVFGGYDTTAMTLGFAMLLLAENKEIQDKARAEVEEVFEERRDGKFSIRDIQRLGYLE